MPGKDWTDEEADVNDYRHPATGTRFHQPEHIFPHLHGTGGVGPGQWRRHGLAGAQETHAALKKLRAANIVLDVTMAIRRGTSFTSLVETVTRHL